MWFSGWGMLLLCFLFINVFFCFHPIFIQPHSSIRCSSCTLAYMLCSPFHFVVFMYLLSVVSEVYVSPGNPQCFRITGMGCVYCKEREDCSRRHFGWKIGCTA